MFNSLAAKVLLGAGALAAAGGTTALAASPAVVAPAPGAAQGAKHHHAANVRQGVIIAVKGDSMTIERTVRDKTTKAVTKDDTTFQVTDATKVYRAGSKTPVGHDALKVGERVRVRFAETDGKKVARRIVIERDLRMGKVLSKDGSTLVIHTPKHGDVTVTVSEDTKFTTGHRKDGKDGSLAAIKVGDRVVALGEETSPNHFKASAVRYNDPPAKKAAPKSPKAQ